MVKRVTASFRRIKCLACGHAYIVSAAATAEAHCPACGGANRPGPATVTVPKPRPQPASVKPEPLKPASIKPAPVKPEPGKPEPVSGECRP